MLPNLAVLITDDLEVRQELRALALTQEFVKEVARAVAGGKAEAMSVDPMNAAGQFAYIKGVRTMRLKLVPEGWRIGRKRGVEAIIDHRRAIQLCYQNVDVACTAADPKAISGKGSGSRELVSDGRQMEMFKRDEGTVKQARGVAPLVWVLCVSTSGNRLRAEVSCPEVFKGDQFEGFSKRIFVVDEELDSTPTPTKRTDDDQVSGDHEVRIVKKA